MFTFFVKKGEEKLIVTHADCAGQVTTDSKFHDTGEQKWVCQSCGNVWWLNPSRLALFHRIRNHGGEEFRGMYRVIEYSPEKLSDYLAAFQTPPRNWWEKMMRIFD